jgi:hypothetical protein
MMTSTSEQHCPPTGSTYTIEITVYDNQNELKFNKIEKKSLIHFISKVIIP